jgi:hypothetical protein
VDAIELARRQKAQLERTAKHLKRDEIIPAFYPPSLREHYEACWLLPDVHGRADEGWNGRVKGMLKQDFDRMRLKPTHNPPLWEELNRATDGGTANEKWRVLEKNCRNKLNQIAGENAPQV